MGTALPHVMSARTSLLSAGVVSWERTSVRTPVWSGISFQGSNDGVNWESIPAVQRHRRRIRAGVDGSWAAGTLGRPATLPPHSRSSSPRGSSGGTKASATATGAVPLPTAPAARRTLAPTDVVTGNITSGTADGGSAPVEDRRHPRHHPAVRHTRCTGGPPGHHPRRPDRATGAYSFSVNTPSSQAASRTMRM